jgi:hypothetical protein
MIEISEEERAAIIEREDLLQFLKTESGRRVLFQIIYVDAGIRGLSFAGEQTHATAFNEGQRNVGQRLLARCEIASPKYAAQIIADHHAKSNTGEQKS